MLVGIAILKRLADGLHPIGDPRLPGREHVEKRCDARRRKAGVSAT
jgi:hypothetical protein